MLKFDPRFSHGLRVSKSLPYVYLDVPKSASSTMRATLWEMERVNDPGVEEVPGVLDKLNLPASPPDETTAPWAYLYTLGDRPRCEVFLFTFVRNPFIRTLSAYLEKICLPGDPHRIKFYETHGVDEGYQISFFEFLEYLVTEPYETTDGHWGLQSYMTAVEFVDFDFIGKVENLEKDMAVVFSEMAKRSNNSDLESCKVVNFRPHASGAHSRVAEYYMDSRCERLVLDIYEADFNHFAYSKSVGDVDNVVQGIQYTPTERGWSIVKGQGNSID